MTKERIYIVNPFQRFLDFLFVLFIIDMLQRKEEKSKVSKALIQLADAIEDTGIVRAKLARALYFPVLTLIVGLILFLFIAAFVLPVFQDMFSSFGDQLPGPTQLLLSLSNWIAPNMLYIIALIIILVVLIVANKRFAYFIEGLIPGYRKLSKWSSIISFSKHLPVMLSFELPLRSAIKKAASTVKNSIHAGKLTDAAEQVVDAPVVPIAWIPGYASVPKGMTVIGENKSNLMPRLMPMSCRY